MKNVCKANKLLIVVKCLVGDMNRRLIIPPFIPPIANAQTIAKSPLIKQLLRLVQAFEKVRLFILSITNEKELVYTNQNLSIIQLH